MRFRFENELESARFEYGEGHTYEMVKDRVVPGGWVKLTERRAAGENLSPSARVVTSENYIDVYNINGVLLETFISPGLAKITNLALEPIRNPGPKPCWRCVASYGHKVCTFVEI